MGQTSSNIDQCLCDMAGKRETGKKHLNKHQDSNQYSRVAFRSLWLLVEDTNRSLDFTDDVLSPVLDVTESETFLVLAIVIQMGHDTRDSLKESGRMKAGLLMFV